MEKVYSEAREYVKTFATSYRNMLFLGSVGGGKTFLANCIAKALLDKGYSVIYFSAFRLFELIADNTFRHNDPEERGGFFSNIYDSDLLIIDDLGTELTNQFVSAQLFACINERHLNRKPTVISTNLSLEDLQKRYSDRVFSRITSGYICCKLTGKDIRLLKKVRTMNGTHQET
jgi:DNA replication protein DnaC